MKCNTPFMKEAGKSSTMYNHADLVRYLTKSIALPVNPRQLRLTLEPYLRLHKDVSASWYGRLGLSINVVGLKAFVVMMGRRP